ncbi:MAG TPA: EVE domain-containing protein [Thermoplasmata archaeon]|nr:EVE domain-containing protein [Thermoplasmata archaeon]
MRRAATAGSRRARFWLVKEEPSHYAFADLVRDGRTRWDSVHNPLAQHHLRSMRAGDRVLYYHTGGVRAIVGLAAVDTAPRPDPADARAAWYVELRAERALERPVPLEVLKDDATFRDSPLVRIGRLSVLEITPSQWRRVLVLGAPGPHRSGGGALRPRGRGGGRGTEPSAARTGGPRRRTRATGS